MIQDYRLITADQHEALEKQTLRTVVQALQQSQLPMDAEFESRGKVYRLEAGIPHHLPMEAFGGDTLVAVTTSSFVHFYYEKLESEVPPYHKLRTIYALLIPHQVLKPRYNPDPKTTFFGQGKHSPARQEVPRIRVYFSRLREMCPWRLQELHYISGGGGYTAPRWRDSAVSDEGELTDVETEFAFIGR